MKILKKLGLALLIATSMGTFSSAVFAEDMHSRTEYGPNEAIDLVVSKIKIAQAAIAENDSGELVAGKILDALHASKEVNANDVVDRNRAKANDVLKAAKKLAKEGHPKDAAPLLDEATTKFEALRAMI